MKVDIFDFTLPESLIAINPMEDKGQAKLLHVSSNDKISDQQIKDIPTLLQPGDVLVCNNTKVIPARLYGKRGEASVEVTLHKQHGATTWSAFAKPARKLQLGDVFVVSSELKAKVVDKGEGGEVHLCFECQPEEFFSLIEQYGAMPLPPYIAKKRTPDQHDIENYQTVFAKAPGAVAAPTAGLHFTDDLLKEIEAQGVSIEQVTLHVGGGTFLPIKVEDTESHVMHSEYGEITKETADFLNRAKKEGRRIVAVGSTSLRILETSTDKHGVVFPFAGETDIFITPGYRFRCVDVLVTNFHLPKSTLFMLVCAFAGIEIMKQAYQHAIDSHYRFYSYGDACFLECSAKV